ncbi:MAG: toxin co-regulated pilus biosynthesis Q family protein [Alphaproteobacteria bacterium]|nr:toxin co-regulated pilus biosynthesis Q family protein [Alphaproteobacteria bacterium]
MFRKILIAAMLATAAGYCFAGSNLPQVVTSEVFYDEDVDNNQDTFVQETQDYYQQDYQQEYQPVYQPVQYVPQVPVEIPAWPLAGSEADVTVSCEKGVCARSAQSDNIKIVSKIGSDLVVENNFNLGAHSGTGWSGGANMLHGNQVPFGFDYECQRGSEMPLLRREVMEDDGGAILSVSRSGSGACARYADGYDAYLARNGLVERTSTGEIVTGAGVISVDENGVMTVKNPDAQNTMIVSGEMSVDISADAEPANTIQDQVRSWVVASGQTLRQVLQSWCDKEGWDLVWATSREYPIQASAVFKGRFVDVASAVVRNFGRAIPVPYAKFYKGNRVLVVSTTEE